MQLDGETWLYALGGAALLIAGGAVLRGGSAPAPAPPPPSPPEIGRASCRERV